MNWRLLLVSLVLCAGCLEAPAASYALIIGVSEYADPSIADLEYAASDARELALALETQCGFARPNILLLVEDEATRDGIAAGFAWLNEHVGPSDLAFVYFAGHGSAVVDREGDEADGDGMDECILPQDTVLLNPATYITDDQLGAWIAELGSGAVSLFLDSCYSGG
ncbi:MAG: caspase family protein, partial [Candidatus Bipolaricaulota bacterium]|nr:caspase family protein [Candidatus Bipolaricaulota bacterium]